MSQKCSFLLLPSYFPDVFKTLILTLIVTIIQISCFIISSMTFNFFTFWLVLRAQNVDYAQQVVDFYECVIMFKENKTYILYWMKNSLLI